MHRSVLSLLPAAAAAAMAEYYRDLSIDLQGRVRELEDADREREAMRQRMAAWRAQRARAPSKLKRDYMIVRLAWNGASTADLARRFGLHPKTVGRIIRQRLAAQQHQQRHAAGNP